MDNRKCVILVPVHYNIEPHCELSLRQLETRGYAVRRHFGSPAVDRARNRMATEALAAGFEELMWIDGDVAFEPASVDRLRSHGLPIVCGMYPTKVHRNLSSLVFPETKQLVFGKEGGLLEIRYAATGFLLTHRQVYLDVQKHEELPTCDQENRLVVPYFLPMLVPEENRPPRYLGCDYAFCERARRSGYKIVADTTIRLQHIGVYGYSWEDLGERVGKHETYTLTFAPPSGSPAGG
ncbi:MAG: hypothetical protein K2R98_20625 [Gemmataceae bacterium]|nr:hypothetical protein [Gemmataceae bacterium]